MICTILIICVCRLPKPVYWTVFRNRIDLFKLLLLSNASAAHHHLSYYLQMFGGDSQAMMATLPFDSLLQEINVIMSTPRELRDLCRLAIRSHLALCCHGCGILCSVSQLPLPRSLLSYLSYGIEVRSEWEDDDDVDIALSFQGL